MEIIPPVRMVAFEKLEPGDLFLYMDGQHKFYALKTALPRPTMVMLGPTFIPPDITESYLLSWDAGQVLSLGKNFHVLLPTGAADWVWSGQTRAPPIYLAVAGSELFICTNGGRSSQAGYVPCFVNIRTGSVLEGGLPGTSVYTNKWEIAAAGEKYPTRTVLKFPLSQA